MFLPKHVCHFTNFCCHVELDGPAGGDYDVGINCYVAHQFLEHINRFPVWQKSIVWIGCSISGHYLSLSSDQLDNDKCRC